jgi:hypothetical protein
VTIEPDRIVLAPADGDARGDAGDGEGEED